MTGIFTEIFGNAYCFEKLLCWVLGYQKNEEHWPKLFLKIQKIMKKHLKKGHE